MVEREGFFFGQIHSGVIGGGGVCPALVNIGNTPEREGVWYLEYPVGLVDRYICVREITAVVNLGAIFKKTQWLDMVGRAQIGNRIGWFMNTVDEFFFRGDTVRVSLHGGVL